MESEKYIFILVTLRIVPGSITPAVYETFRWSNPVILFVFPDTAKVFIALKCLGLTTNVQFVNFWLEWFMAYLSWNLWDLLSSWVPLFMTSFRCQVCMVHTCFLSALPSIKAFVCWCLCKEGWCDQELEEHKVHLHCSSGTDCIKMKIYSELYAWGKKKMC